ncbi:MAG: RluA family pseudouridine synthase [Alphaproteobacteria bacterium]
MAGVQLLEVKADEADIRLDRWFSRRFPGLTHGKLQKLLRTGQVRVDGARAKSGQRLEAGQTVRVPPLDDGATVAREALLPRPKISNEEADKLRARVLYRDDDVLVLDKPAGLATQGGTGTTKHLDGMLDALRFGSKERPRLVHRLDRDTSGVLLLARSAASAKRLAEAFRSRDALKIYWAFVVGVPQPYSGTIDQPLAKKVGPGGERVAAAADDGESAVTHYAIVEAMGRDAAWVALMPLTGRTHQLRVHMALLGTPILGDGKYGGAAAFLPDLAGARQVHLHAREIRLPHPSGKGLLRAVAPLPPHMVATWKYFDLDLTDDGDPFGIGAP